MPDTYTSQFSGEEIDSALRAAQMISGASTPAELRDKLEIRGDTIPVSATDPTPVSEALSASGGGINPNLLDNWFFGNPVNQRGKTSYSTEWGYTIDRWSIATDSSLIVNNGSISLTGGYVFEPLEEIVDALKGKTVTVSLLFATGELEFATGVVPTTWGEWDAIASNNHVGLQGIGKDSKRLWFLIRDNAENFLAAKLELGDTQTLAHKENGVWVLNEIPDYGEQLRRCQRCAFSPLFEAYATAVICNLFVSNAANGIAFGEVTLPVSMRSKPVFSGNASKFWIVAENGGGASHPTAIAVMGLSADKVMIQVNGSYTANTQYILYVENPFTSADFLLSADL